MDSSKEHWRKSMLFRFFWQLSLPHLPISIDIIEPLKHYGQYEQANKRSADAGGFRPCGR
jgi:hypothetical protein